MPDMRTERIECEGSSRVASAAAPSAQGIGLPTGLLDRFRGSWRRWFAVVLAFNIALGMGFSVVALRHQADSRSHADALKELTTSFQSEVAPQVVEVEGHTLRLTGTVEDQYREWRKLLKQLYLEETGVAAAPPPASEPAPKPASTTTTASGNEKPPSG